MSFSDPLTIGMTVAAAVLGITSVILVAIAW
jgi:hypothetical protein